ncbi:unnamed protein product, partial [Nesidiocoris tenuis]
MSENPLSSLRKLKPVVRLRKMQKADSYRLIVYPRTGRWRFTPPGKAKITML